MFRARDQLEFGQGGPTAVAAALSHAQILRDEPAAKNPALSLLADRLRIYRARLEAGWHRLDLVHDLAEDIGSLRWYRGFGTMLGLSVAALSFWPDLSAVEAATTHPVDGSSRDEFRSQMIMPLALGGDSGRRMGASALVVPIANAPERKSIRLVASLGQGDSFGRMLQRAGVGAGDAARVTELVASKVSLGDIEPGTRFDITLGQREAPGTPRSLAQLDFRAQFGLNLSVDRRGGSLALAARPIAVDATPLRIRGIVGSSLYRSARAAGAPVAAIQQYLQTLDGHVSLEGDVAPTDQFDFIVAYKRSANGESETGKLLYAGLDRAGKPVADLLRWSDGGFYDASGMVTQRSSVFAPVNGRMTSGYGMRFHPVLRYARMHAGIDFGAAWGSPIFAVSDGIVSYAGPHGGHGNYVRLAHGGGLGTGYGHMSRIAVSPGSRVQAGQVIGYVGSTGLSTGPHLHYEVYENGRTVNPLSVRFAVNSQVDTSQLAAFKAKLAELKKVVPGAALKSLAAKQAVVKQP